jgi:uncharacterized protein (DUF1499 family)
VVWCGVRQFVDDVEFYFSDDEGDARVEYRSASRLGSNDGDANRKRIRVSHEYSEQHCDQEQH